MHQEINLYKPIETIKEPAAFLSWKRFWLFNLIFFVLLILYYVLLSWEMNQLESQKTLLTNHNKNLEKQFYALKATYPAQFFSSNIDESIKNLEKELIFQERLMTSMQNTRPFSTNLITLGQLHIENVWLTKILINDSGKQITLQGKSIGPANLNHFITRLTASKTFKDYAMTVNNIENPSKNPIEGIFDFEVSLNKRI